MIGAQSLPDKPAMGLFIKDEARLFSAAEQNQLQAVLQKVAEGGGDQIVVATVADVAGYDMGEYAVALGRKWGIGQKNEDNGVLLLIETKGRQVFIATGRKSEIELTDIVCKRIIARQMTPAFQKEAYYEGVVATIEEILRVWSRSADRPEAQRMFYQQFFSDNKLSQRSGTMRQLPSKKEKISPLASVAAVLAGVFLAIVIVVLYSRRTEEGQGRGCLRLLPSVLWGLFLAMGTRRGGNNRGRGHGFGGGDFGGGGAGGRW